MQPNIVISTSDLLFMYPSHISTATSVYAYSRGGHRQWKNLAITYTHSQQPTPDNLLTNDKESTTITYSDNLQLQSALDSRQPTP
jgi:hypothetical protein